MRVVFLGGASQIGASCLAVEVGSRWLVIDAGVRVGGTGDPLPDLALLNDKPVAAVLVTHAHADHIGALPLLHAAFPAAPIYATRATCLLLDVMLADALKIMGRRAAEELDVPLYTDVQLASTLNALRPLPVGTAITLPEIPDLTVTATPAGHVAGAVCLSLAAADGTLVVSGDVSITAQRTIPGASIPPIKRPDLLILESTYGLTALHPNRDAEEIRLAEAVAQVIAGGGHVLIPAFALGRAQEILLILKAAQGAGQIPRFPIIVDGLVRRVCATYQHVPEALNPKLARAIQRGQLPFSGPTIRMIADERDRAAVLAGPPACIIASSGMLTGGPSAWYGARLAEQERAAIFLTGYQDEESPGRKLLALVGSPGATLTLEGRALAVRCRVEKYALSAHADATELVGFAGALAPRAVALVHGGDEPRQALAARLAHVTVHLPREGDSLDVRQASRRGDEHGLAPRGATIISPASLAALPQGLGDGQPLTLDDLPTLHDAIRGAEPERMAITLRELARAWYPQPTADHERQIAAVLRDDVMIFHEVEDLPGVYDLIPPTLEAQPARAADLSGMTLFVRINGEFIAPAYCVASDAMGLRLALPSGSGRRTRFLLADVLEVLGPWPSERDLLALPRQLKALDQTAQRYRAQHPRNELATAMEAGATYDLATVCELAGVMPEDLAGKLAIAHMLNDTPGVFVRSAPLWEYGGPARYGLHPDARQALMQEAPRGAFANTAQIQTRIDRVFAGIDDLIKRGTDPVTGDITLTFEFPEVARVRYAELIERLAGETGVAVTIAPRTNQMALTRVARSLLPPALRPEAAPSVYAAQHLLRLVCHGNADPDMITDAQTRFTGKTGWQLDLWLSETETYIPPPNQPPPNRPSTNEEATVLPPEAEASTAPIDATAPETKPVPPRMEQNLAMAVARQGFPAAAGLYKIGMDPATGALLLRFTFPEIACERYRDQIAQVERETGRRVMVHPTVHQGALEQEAQRLLPPGLEPVGSFAIHHDQRTAILTVRGALEAADLSDIQAQFTEITGWRLVLQAQR